jgi:RimJ/RimL family protein N-acetyltransferase
MDSAPALAAGSVTLRELTTADVDDMVVACQDPETARWTTVPSPYEPEHAFAFIERRIGSVVDDESPRWGIEVDGRWSGNISLRPDGVGLADVGYLVAPWARGRGVGTLALWLVCDWAFREGECEVVTWNALVGNAPSRRMVEKVGFHVHADVSRRLVVQRGERADAWTADLLPEDLVPLDSILP